MVKSYNKKVKVKVGGEGEGENTKLSKYTAYNFHSPTISSDGKTIPHNSSQTIDWRGRNNSRTRTAARKRYENENKKYKNKQLNMLRLKPNKPEYVVNSSNNEYENKNENPVINLTESHKTAIANAEQYQQLKQMEKNMEQTPAARKHKQLKNFNREQQYKSKLPPLQRGSELNPSSNRGSELNPSSNRDAANKAVSKRRNTSQQIAGNRNTKKLSTKKRNTKNRNTKKRK